MAFSSSYLLGLFFIFLVTILWSGASIIVQYLYTELNFHSPFLLTYVSTSLFTILLPTRVLWEKVLQCKDHYCRRSNEDAEGEYHNQFVIPFKSGPPPTNEEVPTEDEINPCLDKKCLEIDGNYSTISNESDKKEDAPFILGHYETFLISLRIAPLWFLADYTYNLSLAYTSITSSTILANTGTLFTFLFALSCGEERFSWYKLCGVTLCMVGSVLTGLEDIENDDVEKNKEMGALGDIAGLLSAIGYGGYTILIRVLCPRDESQISMQLLFGYIGLLNLVAFSPFLLITLLKHSSGITTNALLWLIIKGLLDNVLSDYLWARSVVLCTATVATVGLGLTIPLAFLSDWVISGIMPNLITSFGAFAVLIGFIFVNVGEGG